MTTLFAGELDVDYSTFSLQSSDASPDAGSACGGQVNGLCGAALPGVLLLRTGLRMGPVPLVVEVLPTEPAVGSEWEDVVEVSFVTRETALHLQSFDVWVDLPPLPAAGSYRVRYSARGIDAADDLVRFPENPPIDQYLLQLWPAPVARDAILRRASTAAAYWHETAQATPPPVSEEAPEGPEERRRRLQREVLLGVSAGRRGRLR